MMKHVLALLQVHTATAVTWRVCPQGCDFRLPSMAVNEAANGDEIVIEAAVYQNFFTIQPNRPDGSVTQDIYIRGEVGAVLEAPEDGSLARGQAIIWNEGINTWIENLEIRGADCPEASCGGIRHTGFNLTLQNVWVRDNDYGIRATRSAICPQRANLDIFGSVFERDGDENDTGFVHNVLVENCTRLRFHNSISRDATNGGQLIRSQADLNEIHHSVIASLEGVREETAAPLPPPLIPSYKADHSSRRRSLLASWTSRWAGAWTSETA